MEIADKAKADAVNASAETKVKTYACVVWFSADRSDEDARRVSASAPLAVQQKDARPRDALAVAGDAREARAAAEADDDQPAVRRPGVGYLGGDVHQGVRPWRFGPHGPSLASLAGCDADILQLDVLDVHDASRSLVE